MNNTKLTKLLKAYKTICDFRNHDYKFHYIEDIVNNEDAVNEIKSYIEELPFQFLTLKRKPYNKHSLNQRKQNEDLDSNSKKRKW